MIAHRNGEDICFSVSGGEYFRCQAVGDIYDSGSVEIFQRPIKSRKWGRRRKRKAKLFVRMAVKAV